METRSQLFMVPEFREGVLGFRDSERMPSEDSVMWQLQNMFSHLQVRTGATAAVPHAVVILFFEAKAVSGSRACRQNPCS